MWISFIFHDMLSISRMKLFWRNVGGSIGRLFEGTKAVRLICNYVSFRCCVVLETLSRFLRWIGCRRGSHACAPHPGTRASVRRRARSSGGSPEHDLLRLLEQAGFPKAELVELMVGTMQGAWMV
jgi:hypothetical protein